MAGGIWQMGEDATKQTFTVPGVTSSTVANAPRILPERLVRMHL